MALVISALEVYGKQMFRTALRYELARIMRIRAMLMLCLLLVVLGHLHSSVDEGEDVVRDEVSLA